jgi:hypothetical protein
MQEMKPQVTAKRVSDLLSLASDIYLNENEKISVIKLPKISKTEVSSPVPVKSTRPEAIESNPAIEVPLAIPRHVATKVEEVTKKLLFETPALKDERRITRKKLLACQLIRV